MRDKQKRRRERTWAEAAKMVLDNYSDAPMTPKQILNVIEAEGLKDIKSGSSPLACLNAMLHSNSRTRDALFYKLPGRISLFTLKKNAVQWSRGVPLPEEDPQDTADEESSQWAEGSAVTPVESPETDSSSQEPCVRETRSLVQKRRSGVLLPRVVLTPLKVNGAHLPSTSSGMSVRRLEGNTSTSRSLARSLTFHRRAALAGSSTHHLRSRQPVAVPVKKKEEEIDVETPGSILVNTNLRALINVRTFNALPSSLQQQLLNLLPEVDRQVTPEGQVKMSGSALNNEFFAHACLRWRERLADGEFTPEMQLRLRQEMGKEKKVEDWKEKFFEDFYGQKLGLCEDPGSDPEDKCSQADNTSEALLRTSPEPLPAEEPIPEIRVRTRRSLYRNRERLLRTLPSATAVKTTYPPARAEVVAPPPEDRLAPAEAASLPSTSDRVPELHPQTSDQKRKTSEPEGSTPSVEKKPRMEQRQSFRNTIACVHPEKPQPTKEEPKVPPIRIQLSRIKPPWVVKGLPAYQICPRIIPNPDPPGCKPPACSPAYSQAGGGDLQTSIGGGGGPGGGHRPRDRRNWSRDSKRRRRRRSTKRRHRKKPTNCCRTQLLPSPAVRDSAQPPHVKVKITRTISSPETKEHSLPCTVAKEWHVSEVVIPDVGSGAPSLKPCKGIHLEKSSSACRTEGPTDVEREENLREASLTSSLFGDSLIEGNSGHSLEVPSSVLGDVSNTFRNRIKPVTSNVEKKVNDVALSSHPDLQDDANSYQATQTSVESLEPQTSDIPEDLGSLEDSSLGGALCKSDNAMAVREPSSSDLLDNIVQSQTCVSTGSSSNAFLSGLQSNIDSAPQAENSSSPSENITISLPSDEPLACSKRPTLTSKEADFLALDGSVSSCPDPSIPLVAPKLLGKGFENEENLSYGGKQSFHDSDSKLSSHEEQLLKAALQSATSHYMRLHWGLPYLLFSWLLFLPPSP